MTPVAAIAAAVLLTAVPAQQQAVAAEPPLERVRGDFHLVSQSASGEVTYRYDVTGMVLGGSRAVRVAFLWADGTDRFFGIAAGGCTPLTTQAAVPVQVRGTVTHRYKRPAKLKVTMFVYTESAGCTFADFRRAHNLLVP